MGIAGLTFSWLIVCIIFRKVVSTNEVHIVQSGDRTISYGKDTSNGNVYYEFPSFMPVIGVKKIVLPVSVFSLDLNGYAAYDVGRLPFVVDIQAFFRIKDSNLAASRISDLKQLQHQLMGVMQGAARAMLASSEIEEIMQGRSEFGEKFTKEVHDQLSNWGIETVKNIELMDIRDAQGGEVVSNIMEKKKSYISMQSRVEVANNRKTAVLSEIDADASAKMKQVEAAQAIETKQTEKERIIGIAKEKSLQDVREQQLTTKEKEMQIIRAQDVIRQEITRDMGIVQANEAKQAQVLEAEAILQSELLKAQGITAVGEANANSEKVMQLASVEAQVVLAKEIGENTGYQNYLITLEKIKSMQAVGIEQAKALMNASIKIIANAGDVPSTMNGVSDILSSKGGMAIGAALEGLSQTEMGKKVIDKITNIEGKK